MLFTVSATGILAVFSRVGSVAMGGVRMVCGLLVIAGIVMLRSFLMMLGCVGMMFGCLAMVIGSFF